MLKYQILINGNQFDKNIIIPISNSITPKMDTSLDDFINDTTNSLINPIINNEKEAFIPKNSYTLIYNFYNGTNFSSDWTAAGFNINQDLNKNIFKKSLFLLEFYDGDISSSNIYKFSTTLSLYPNNQKGADSTNGGVYTINNIKNELYNIYFNRDINNQLNLKSDSSGNTYISLYMKSMFLNAKTGLVQYFVNNDSVVLNYNTFKDTLYFYELRLYNDLTYGFYKNNVIQNSVIFNELVIK